jgi:alanine racemase
LGESRLEVSRTALLHNISLLRRQIPTAAKLCAVVKANAYGHDASIVADTLCNFTGAGAEAPAVDALAVATIPEALALPHVDVPIMVFQPVENALIGEGRKLIEEALSRNLILTLTSKSAADDLARVATVWNVRASVQVMIDTGMARAGVGVGRASELLEKATSWPSLRLVGVLTHFVESEVPDSPVTQQQLADFMALTKDFAGKITRHAANSGGVFFVPDAHFDLVRPGISVYGVDPTCKPDLDRKLRLAGKWIAPLAGIRDIPAGTGVGYNHTWKAERDTRIGLVPIGYADGYPRILSNWGTMIVNNQTAPVIGNISMDLITIDLRSCPNAKIGDDVIIMDTDPLSPASVYRMAELAHTIPYEIFTKIGNRVKRLAVDPTEPAPAVK